MGAQGHQRFPRFKPEVGIQPCMSCLSGLRQSNMLCLCTHNYCARVFIACCFLLSRFNHLRFLQTSPNKVRETPWYNRNGWLGVDNQLPYNYLWLYVSFRLKNLSSKKSKQRNEMFVFVFCTLCCPNGNVSQGKFWSLSPTKASCNRVALPNPNKLKCMLGLFVFP